MKIEKLLQLFLIVLISPIMGACGDSDKDEPTIEDDIFTVNGEPFDSEMNILSLFQFDNFQLKGVAYHHDAVTDNSFPELSIVSECEPFEINESSVGKILKFKYFTCGYFYDKDLNYTYYDKVVSGSVKVVSVENPFNDVIIVSIRYDHVKLTESGNPSNTILLNGVLQYWVS